MMFLAEYVLTAQVNGGESPASNPIGSWYLVMALAAVVVAMIVMIFIRTSARRSR